MRVEFLSRGNKWVINTGAAVWTREGIAKIPVELYLRRLVFSESKGDTCEAMSMFL